MKRTIGRITRTAMLAVAFMLCASSAWAVDADYVCVNFGYNSYSFVGAQSGEKGISPYAVVGTRWTDVDNTGFSGTTVKAYDVDGNESSDSITVSVSGGTGSPHYWNNHDYGLFSGYIDDSASALTPSASFSGVPFDYYRVIVYFSSDGTRPIGHITVNDVLDLKGSGNSTVIGTVDNSGWGSVPSETFTEGLNVLVSPVLAKTSGSTVKVLGHASHTGSGWNYRSCIAAIQIFKVADTPSTCTYTAPGTDTYNLFGAGNWDKEPESGSEAVTIAISGNTTLTVNDSRVFRSLTITGSGELTFAGTGTIITPSLTIDSGITLVKTAGNISSSATVSVPSGCTFEIASACTWSGVISGAGKVKVSADTVTFSAVNTFTGGLTVANGGHAKTTVRYGFSPSGGSVTVDDGGAIDLGGIVGADESNYALTIAGEGVLVNGVRTGAAYTSSDVTASHKQLASITLSGDATIKGQFGLIQSNYTTATTLTLNGHTLTKAGSGNFYLTKTTASDTTGSIVISGGSLNPYGNKGSSDKNDIACSITVKSGGKLKVDSYLEAADVTCEEGGSVLVSSGNFLVIKNGKTLTANGSVDIEGTGRIDIGASGNAGSHLVVGGAVNVNGAGNSGVGLRLISTSDITKNGTGMINIAAGATVQWINHSWTEGDVFRGDGTLFLDGSGGNWSYYASSAFGGILKVGTRTGDNYAYFSDDLSIYTGQPTLRLECGTEVSPGLFRFGQSGANTTFAVKNLSGWGRIYPWSSTAGAWIIDTLQTTDTVFSGKFIKYESAEANSALIVHGNTEANDIKSLTLSNESTTKGYATVYDNAKLIFTSTGSWASGTINVDNGGHLEVTNSASVATTLNLKAGGTLKIAKVSDVAQKVTVGTVNFPSSGTATIDVSDIPDLEAEGSVVIVEATTLDSVNIGNLRLVGKPYSLTCENNQLKVVNDGGLAWDSANGWGSKDVTKYDCATITASSADDTVTLPANVTFDTLTLAGSGAITISGSNGAVASVRNLYVPAGVTLNLNSSVKLAGANVTGAVTGVLNIPEGTSYTMTNVTCAVKVVCAGSLTTCGTVTMTTDAWARFESTSELTVENGTTTIHAEGSSGFQGKVTIAAGATLANTNSNSLGSDAELDISGTLDLGSTYWTLGASNAISLHDKAQIAGSNTANGALDYNRDGNEKANKSVITIEDGSATIDAMLRVRGSRTLEIDVAQDAELRIVANTWDFSGYVNKKGLGRLTITATAIWNGVTTVEAGQIVTGVLPKTSNGGNGKVEIQEGAIFTLKDCVWADDSTSDSTKDRFSGAGTLELFATNDSPKHTHTAKGSSFSGILLLSNENSAQCNLNPSGAATFTTTPELILTSNHTYLGDGYYKESSTPHGSFDVRDLSGSGYLCAYWASASEHAYTLKTKQTKDTYFSGGLAMGTTGSVRRFMNLEVVGDDSGDVHSLTLNQGIYQQESVDTSKQSATLTVSDNAKVIFTENGKWIAGKVVIGEDGWLQSTNNAAVKNLTLEDGSHIAFPTSSSTLTGITNLVFTSGTVYVSFLDGAPDSGTIIDWTSVGSAPAGTFVLEGAAAETHILTKGETGLTIAKGLVSLTVNGVTTPYATAQALLVPLALNANTYDYVTILASGTVSLLYRDGLKIKNPNGATVTFYSGVAEDMQAVYEENENGIRTYTKANKPTIYTWTGADPAESASSGTSAHRRWTTIGNWTFENSSSVTTAATRYPQAGDTVVFSADKEPAKLESAAACARIEVNGSARIYADSTKTLTVSGDVVLRANGITLTLDKVTLSANSVTTDVEGKVVKWVVDGNTTTYTVVDPVARIGDVKYGSLGLAIAAASDNDIITLAADCSESVNLGGKTITFNEGSYTFTGSFTGSGTLALSSALKSAAAARWAEGWTGTVELKDITTAITGFSFNNYGNAASTVRMNNVKCRFADGSIGDVGCIDVVNDGLILDTADWQNDKTKTIAADITGGGTISISSPCNTAAGYTYYVFTGDMSGFSGALNYGSIYSSSYYPIIVIQGEGDTVPTATAAGQIYVTEHASVNVGASWNGTHLVVNGEVSVKSGGSLSGTLAGNGQIDYSAMPALAPTVGSSWTGTVVLPAFTAAGHNFNSYGRSGSKVKLSGVNSGWLVVDNLTFAPEIVLDGDFSITDMSERTYTFNKISGSGDITFTPPQQHEYKGLTIAELDSGYEGRITNNMRNTKLTITRLVLASDPTVAKEMKILDTATADKITVQNVYYNNEPVTISGSLSIVNKADGIYIVRAGTIFSVW